LLGWVVTPGFPSTYKQLGCTEAVTPPWGRAMTRYA
jgi:hypothetical protein